MRPFRKMAASAALSLFLPLGAAAQGADAASYPSKPVTVLAPFAAGGTVDIIARLVGQKLSADLGQPFVVDNRGGAGGTIATGMLARAAPDGYTVMVQHMGLAFNAGLYEKLPFDTARDIRPVAYIGATPNVLVVSKSLPVNSGAEFLAYAKANPGKINYGSGGVGSAGHVPMAVVASMTGLKMQHVPYKGSGPAIVDLMSGQIHAMLLTIPAVMPFIQQGSLRALATSGARRSPALPDLPTMEEVGVKGFEYEPWYGYFVPAGTPPAIQKKLHDAVDKALQDPVIISKLREQGLEVKRMSQQEFVDIVARDTAAWSAKIKALGLRAD